MKVLNFLTSIGNQFLFAFVAFKCYIWFSPEVGFDLPTLTYLNVFAITLLIAIFKGEAMVHMYIGEIHEFTKPEVDPDDVDLGASIKLTFIYLVVWLYFYIMYSIFF